MTQLASTRSANSTNRRAPTPDTIDRRRLLQVQGMLDSSELAVFGEDVISKIGRGGNRTGDTHNTHSTLFGQAPRLHAPVQSEPLIHSDPPCILPQPLVEIPAVDGHSRSQPQEGKSNLSFTMFTHFHSCIAPLPLRQSCQIETTPAQSSRTCTVTCDPGS